MKKYLKLITILLFIIFLGGCHKKEIVLTDSTNDFLDLKTKTIEVYEDTFLNDILDIKNQDIQITSDNYQIKTDELGSYQILVNYTYNKQKYVYKEFVQIVDTTPPLVFSGTQKERQLNDTSDLCNLITYGDNYDGNINCQIEGEYDLSKLGTYNLIYTLSDSSKNETKVDVTLKVVSKLSTASTSKEKTYFKDVYEKLKTEETEIGIDVSKWQGNIDFNKVKASGASFVMMRLGTSSNNTLTIDSYFKDNLKKAKEAGLKVGVYFYSVASSKEDIDKEVSFILNTLNKEKLDLPIVFDWESWSNWNSFKISFHEINNLATTFIEKIEQNGYKGMLYSSKFYLETIWENKKDYPVWLAHYTKETDYQGDYVIWQLCNNGRIEGINGDVDIDVMYK